MSSSWTSKRKPFLKGHGLRYNTNIICKLSKKHCTLCHIVVENFDVSHVLNNVKPWLSFECFTSNSVMDSKMMREPEKNEYG